MQRIRGREGFGPPDVLAGVKARLRGIRDTLVRSYAQARALADAPDVFDDNDDDKKKKDKKEAKDYIRKKCLESGQTLDEIIEKKDWLKDIDRNYLVKHCGDVRQEYAQGDPGCEALCLEQGKCKVNPSLPKMCCDEVDSRAEACLMMDGSDRKEADEGCEDACKDANMCLRSTRFTDPATGQALCCNMPTSDYAGCRSQGNVSLLNTPDPGCELPCKQNNMCRASNRFKDAGGLAYCCHTPGSDFDGCRRRDGGTQQQTPDPGCEVPCRRNNMCKVSTRFRARRTCCHTPSSDFDGCSATPDGTKVSLKPDPGCDVPCRRNNMCRASARYKGYCCNEPNSDAAGCADTRGTRMGVTAATGTCTGGKKDCPNGYFPARTQDGIKSAFTCCPVDYQWLRNSDRKCYKDSRLTGTNVASKARCDGGYDKNLEATGSKAGATGATTATGTCPAGKMDCPNGYFPAYSERGGQASSKCCPADYRYLRDGNGRCYKTASRTGPYVLQRKRCDGGSGVVQRDEGVPDAYDAAVAFAMV